MASRFVVAKTSAQVLLNLLVHRRLFLPATATATATANITTKKASTYTFVSNNKPVHIATMKTDTMINNDSIIGEKRQKSTERTPNSTTTTSSMMNSSAILNGNVEKEQPSHEDEQHLVTRKKSLYNNASADCTPLLWNDEDKYSAQIVNGFMEVSMMPISTTNTNTNTTQGMGKTPANNNNNTNFPSEKKDKEPSKPSSSPPPPPPSSEQDDRAKIPDTVLQFQRQLRKTQAAKRASTPLLKSQLQIVYNDEHIVVVNKPSGVLTVPGINSNPSMLTMLYEEYKHELDPPDMKMEHMIVHRLDMDTSGIVIYAKTKKALLSLQALFRNREGVSKYYEAVVCGHIHPDVENGSIDLPLQRDHRFPPFMRVATPKSEREAKEVVKDLKNAGWKKIVKKKAKPSQTLFEVIGREYRYYSHGDGDDTSTSVDEKGSQEKENENEGERKGKRYPVTRLKLTPITGRTHQLRVHCASIGHPILGDPTYGIYGEASSNGGFEDDLIDELVPERAPIDLQLSLDQYAKDKGQVMCLHARALHVKHPETGETLVFEQPPAF